MPAKPDPAANAVGTPPPPAPQAAAVPFETSLAELNDLVNRLESGSLGLSDSIGAYERGVAILRRLHEQLADVEERVRLLVRIDEQGRPILETPAAGSAVQSTAAVPAAADTNAPRGPRPAARSPARPKRLPGMDDAGQDG
jgi:exodeoxyribonuclease VII small subunit